MPTGSPLFCATRSSSDEVIHGELHSVKALAEFTLLEHQEGWWVIQELRHQHQEMFHDLAMRSLFHFCSLELDIVASVLSFLYPPRKHMLSSCVWKSFSLVSCIQGVKARRKLPRGCLDALPKETSGNHIPAVK